MNENTNIENHNEMTVGEILRNARTTGRRKREIQTVSKQLCIREEFLQALEDGNYNVIPENVYILGFARNYAMELGLDPDEIVSKLKREMGLVDENQEEDDCKENSTGSDETKEECGISDFFGRVMKFVRRNWKWFLVGFVAVVIVVGLLLFFLMGGSDDAGITSSENNIAPVSVVTEPEYKVEVRERFGTENAETASVILQASQESWVKVEDARGNTVFSRVLVPGDVYYVPTGNGYTAVFGNAGGVDVWVNGTLAPKQGADHVRVAGISLAPDDLLSSAKK